MTEPEDKKEPEAQPIVPEETKTGSEAETITATVKVEQPTVVVEPSLPPAPATKADTDAVIDAVKELTKIIGELQAAIMKKLNAGKF